MPAERAGSSPGGQGKAVPVDQTAWQLRLPIATADDPQGAKRRAFPDRSGAREAMVPKAIVNAESVTPVTMEEVADRLTVALAKVVSNKGAPGPDGQTVGELREQWPIAGPRLAGCLLDGSYRPGAIRRASIPKAGGGQRGLGIPNVIDRVVCEAVRQVLEPVFEPTFQPVEPRVQTGPWLPHGDRGGQRASRGWVRVGGRHRSGEVFRSGLPSAADGKARAASLGSAVARADRTVVEGQDRVVGRRCDRKRGGRSTRLAIVPAAVEHRAGRARLGGLTGVVIGSFAMRMTATST